MKSLSWPQFIIAVAVGVALGSLATWWSCHFYWPSLVADAQWKTNPTAGLASSDPYTRATTAVHGLFALNAPEVLYYSTNTDTDGKPLVGACRYELEGRHDPDARWWSLTVYAQDGFLFANPKNRYSVSKNSIARESNGSFKVELSVDSQSQNSIPLHSEPFFVAIRLYNPSPAALGDLAHVELPVLRKVSCP